MFELSSNCFVGTHFHPCHQYQVAENRGSLWEDLLCALTLSNVPTEIVLCN